MTILPEKRQSYFLLTLFVVIIIGGWFISHNQLATDQSFLYLSMALLLGALYVYRDQRSLSDSNESFSTEDSENIRLGLNYQGRKNLDAAFAVYKKCTPSPKCISLLSNLAEDFEIMNLQDKACEIYQYILSCEPDHTLAVRKLEQLKSDKHIIPENSSFLLNSRYEIMERLGKGTDSSVFHARDHACNGRAVAVKILEINYNNKDQLANELLARFQREAETAASLQHKNIIQVLDSGYADNVAFMTMEYIDGKSLRENSHVTSLLPLPLIVELIAQCADALHYAHGLGIIHRDVKPANILYDQTSGTAKLGDFGIARIANSTQTLAGSFLGTPFYMSPEQLESKPLDERSDIFSLGATLFRLVSGSTPFAGHSIADLMIKIVNQPHRDLKKLNPEIPHKLQEIIDMALAKNPDDRFATAKDFSEKLRECI
jgi:serine/threonine-protein kinase